MAQLIKPTVLPVKTLAGENNENGVVPNQNVIVEAEDLGETVNPTIYRHQEFGVNGVASTYQTLEDHRILYEYDITGRGGNVIVQCNLPDHSYTFDGVGIHTIYGRIEVYQEIIPGSDIFDYDNPVAKTIDNSSTELFFFSSSVERSNNVLASLEFVGEVDKPYKVGVVGYGKKTYSGGANFGSAFGRTNDVYTYISVSPFGAPESGAQTVVIYDKDTKKITKGAVLPPGAIAKYILDNVGGNLVSAQRIGNISSSQWTDLLP